MRQQPLPRTRLNAPRLVRMLAAQGEIGAIDADGKTSFAERVSHWIALTDAIALGRVLGMPARPASSRTQAPAEASAVLASLQAQLARLQATLASPEACGGGSRRSQVRMPAPPSGTVGAAGVEFAPYRHFYLAQQRDMEANVNLLRAAARDALDGLPDAARSLREIDGALQAALAERERALLAGIPHLLERRFEALRRSAADDATAWMLPGGWLATFRAELLALLEAELELRLQPVTGLMETLEHGISLHAKDIGHAQ